MNQNKNIKNDFITIGELSKETGVNSVTLRAWERRYGLLKPTRTPKGHRLYNQADIEYIMTILSWLNKGIAVSKVKSLMNTNTTDYDGNDGIWERYSRDFHTAASLFSEHKIDVIFNKINKQYPFETLLKFCFTPLFESFDNSPNIDPVQYFLNKCLKQRLILMLHRLSKLNNKSPLKPPVIILFSLTQDAMWKVWIAAIWLAEKGCNVHVFDDVKNIQVANELTSTLKPTVSLCFSQGRHKNITKTDFCHYEQIDYMTGADFWLNKAELLNHNNKLNILYQPIDAAYIILDKSPKLIENK